MEGGERVFGVGDVFRYRKYLIINGLRGLGSTGDKGVGGERESGRVRYVGFRN